MPCCRFGFCVFCGNGGVAMTARCAICTAVHFALLSHMAFGQSAARPYDGIQAGLDAFRLAEEQRQATASYQLNLNDNLRFWSGLPTSRGETIYYGYASPAYSAYVPGSILVF